MDVEEFRQRSKNMIDFICDYRKKLDSEKLSDPELCLLKADVPTNAPEAPVAWDTIMQNYKSLFMKGLNKSHHRQWFGNMPVGSSYASMMADMLTDGIGGVSMNETPNTPYSELSNIMMDWLCKALDLPETFLSCGEGAGYFQISQAHCAINCLFTARNHTIKQNNIKLDSGDIAKLIAYFTVDTDYMIKKAVHLTLLTIHIIPCNKDNTVDIDKFKTALKTDLDDGFIPVFLGANLGNSTGGIENLEELGKLCRENNIWFHVNAERIGFSLVCPEMREYAKGVEYADSLSISPDVWGLVHPFCSCLFVKDKQKMMLALKSKLDSNEHNTWMTNVQPYKALNLWFVLQTYGISGIREYYRNHMNLAKYLESILVRDDDFEVVNDVKYNVVCFKLKDANNAVNEKLLESLNNSGDIRLTSDKIRDKTVLVFNVTSEHADEDDINKAYDAIKTCAEKNKNQCTCEKKTNKKKSSLKG